MKVFVFLSLMLFLASGAFAAKPFSNTDSLKNSLGFTPYYSAQNPGRKLKIAVLDKGFFGYEKEIGRTLPVGTRYVAGPVANPENLKVVHGLKMAQILISMMTNDMKATQWIPELTLYNAFGFSNFKAAIDDVIARQYDLVLYSEVWEYGGNFDGGGFINAEVNRATRAGVIWVNAAGNFALTTYNGPITNGHDNWVQMPDQNNALALRCQAAAGKKCPAKIVLSWNDFKDNVEEGTTKDLDLALTDDLLNVIQSSALKQSDDRNEGRPGFSKYPREIISVELQPGLYFLRVKNRSNNFTQRDQLRLTADGEGLVMPSHSRGETLLNPADNPTVITVGASDSDRSSTSFFRDKPDLLAPSSLKLEDGTEYRGSSNSAAIVAAGLGLLKSREPRMTRVDLLNAVSSKHNWEQRGLSLNLLGFGPTGPNCFLDVSFNPLPVQIRDVVARGGVPVQTTAAVRVMVPFDPILLNTQLRRNLLNDMIVAMPQGGYAIYPRRALIPAGAVEIFQRPLEAGLCRPTPVNGKNFHL
nr:hypothetical protein BdHM001_03930 [Bdellovibrio sp. HM001]